MTEYKLYYFDFAGRAEIIRLLFSAAGQKFEDVRFPREKWPEYKPKSPFGQCPYLEITEGSNTYTMAQSIAIARHLARKFSFYGKNELEASIIDMYADVLNDLVAEFAKMRRETDETKKKEIEEKLYKEVVPANMKFFEERLAKSGSGFVVPSGLTWVDIYLFSLLDMNPSKELLFQHFKHIKENYDKVAANPGIANWVKTRPPTQL